MPIFEVSKAQNRFWEHDRGSMVELPLFMALVEVGKRGEHTVGILKLVKQ